MYFPKNKIKTNLFASSDNFTTANGDIYTGYYYELPNGRKYSGKVPGETNSIEIFEGIEFSNFSQDTPDVYGEETNLKSTIALFRDDPEPYQYISTQKERERWNGEITTKYFLLKGGSLNNIPTLNNPTPFIPQPTQKDYNFGAFTRYFVVKVNEDVYIEINKNAFNKIRGGDIKWNYLPYSPFSLIWTLTGDETSVRNVNKNIVELTERRLNRKGLSSFLNRKYLEFYSLNPGVILKSSSPYIRYYPDNILIPENLPKVYQLGNKPNETVNGNVPERQNCSNCVFNLNGNCSKWKASIKSDYWCTAYKGTFGEGKLLKSSNNSQQTQPTQQQSTPSQTTYTPPPSTGGGGYSSGGGGY